MYEYEIHQVRAAELVRQAEHSRLVREAREARRSRARSAAPPLPARTRRAG